MQTRFWIILSLGLLAGAVFLGYHHQVTSAAAGELTLRIDDTPLDRSNRDFRTSYADMLEEVTPAVVSITTSNVVQVPSRPGFNSPLEDFLRRFYGMPDGSNTPQRQREREVQGVGSGLLVTADGYIMTNHHVISFRDGDLVDEILVKLADGREFEAEIVGSDPDTDVAVLKVEVDAELPYLTLADSDNLRVGDVVFAVGNPLRVGLTVTQGIVSGVGRTDLGILGLSGYENFIQTDASINMGNSGGPLVDAYGRVIGINTAILSRSGGNIGIGFAIPVNLARRIMEGIVTGEGVRRGFLGIRISDLNRDLARSFSLESSKGALVTEITEGSPAELAGLRHGEIILEVNGQQVDSASDLRFKISRLEPGSEVRLRVFRDGAPEEISVILGDREGMLAASGISSGGSEAVPVLDGVSMRVLNSDLRERFNLEDDVDGVVVTEVSADSPFGQLMRAGMVILEVNGQSIESVQDMREALRRPGFNRLYVLYEGQRNFFALRLRE
ncbi:MAG: DegQ family serine endoprotease [Opitutales bacterium]